MLAGNGQRISANVSAKVQEKIKEPLTRIKSDKKRIFTDTARSYRDGVVFMILLLFFASFAALREMPCF